MNIETLEKESRKLKQMTATLKKNKSELKTKKKQDTRHDKQRKEQSILSQIQILKHCRQINTNQAKMMNKR